MSNPLFVTVGVCVAWERVDHPWQTERWKPTAILMDPPECPDWRELARSQDAVHYHAANVSLELHRKDIAAYQVNLTHGEPVVYIVLRQSDEPSQPFPVSVHSATVSPFEAQGHGYGSDAIVEGVPMPGTLRAILEAFIAVHRPDMPKQSHLRLNLRDAEEPYVFGTESARETRRGHEGHGS